MYKYFKYSNRKGALILFLFPILFILLLIFNYTYQLRQDVGSEYYRITNEIKKSSKTLDLVNYMFANHFANQDVKDIHQYQRQIDEFNECNWTPLRQHLPSAYRADHKKQLKLNYAIKGVTESCDPASASYQDIEAKSSIFSMFSFLIDLNPYTKGLYYTSATHYVVASPASNIRPVHTKNMQPEAKDTYFWKTAAKNKSEISLSGPYTDLISKETVLSFTSSVYNGDQFNGVFTLDLNISKLLDDTHPLSQYITFVIKDNHAPLAKTNWMIQELDIDGVKTDQIMYFNWVWSEQIRRFISINSDSLILVLTLFSVIAVGLIYARINTERQFYRDLAQHDPLTSLLNRRGFEEAYLQDLNYDYQGIAVFDIDDFKLINDGYGHDVGDEAIRHVAQILAENMTDSDRVARFGGEEFVVSIKSNNKQDIITRIESVKKLIGIESTNIIKDHRFTVSVGLAIHQSAESDLDVMLKEADIKLYQAKRSGKDKVIH